MTTKNRNILILGGTLLLGLLLGWLIFGAEGNEAESHDHAADGEEQETVWTCSMHPQIRAAEPGKCPICGMDLIPLGSSAIGGNPQAVQMTDYALKLANIQTQKVAATSADRELRLNGKVAVDERNLYTQSTHIPGRIERLMVNFTGEEIKRGQALAVVYSPELVTAQEELLQAYAIRESQPELFEASKQKLRNWKIGEGQINRILQSQKASDRFTITADVSGVVTEKLVELGDYVERGMPLYEIADLSKMWVLFDLYERSMGAVEKGDTIEFTVASIPGETFTGTVDFIDPLIDRQTRVATARVEVPNKNGKLKPEMFVSGVLTNPAEETSAKMTIPKSAVLWTGKRSVVYVKEGSTENPEFVMREVVLGPSLGNSYVVEEGLSAQEEIVINGAFTIDAAAQLAGKPSMMNPGSAEDKMEIKGEQEDIRAYLQNNGYNFKGVASADFQKELDGLVKTYLELKDALVTEDESASKKLSREFFQKVSAMEPGMLPGEARAFWEEKQKFLVKHAQLNAEANTFEEKRENFIYLSQAVIKTVAAFGLKNKTLYVDYCPMANSDRGAYWLSDRPEIRNPYYGQAMLSCGEVVETLK